MAKRSIVEFWAKRTAKKALDPEMRAVLMKGYEQQPTPSARAHSAGTKRQDTETARER